MKFVWVFNGSQARLPGGVFLDLPSAEAWIAAHRLSGLLTKYPVGVGVFDWALAEGMFTPRPTKALPPTFIAAFTSGEMEHYHYEDGSRPA